MVSSLPAGSPEEKTPNTDSHAFLKAAGIHAVLKACPTEQVPQLVRLMNFPLAAIGLQVRLERRDNGASAMVGVVPRQPDNLARIRMQLRNLKAGPAPPPKPAMKHIVLNVL
jgi:hypothetical protein